VCSGIIPSNKGNWHEGPYESDVLSLKISKVYEDARGTTGTGGRHAEGSCATSCHMGWDCLNVVELDGPLPL
jgi:hypothetical protein